MTFEPWRYVVDPREDLREGHALLLRAPAKDAIT